MQLVSLWEKQSFLSSDFLIIGAGITGLSAAAHLKEQEPEARVTVLEKGILPTGASTKNAGFACFGSITELLNDITTLGASGMVELVEKRWNGLQKTISRLGADAIDLQVKSGYELLFSGLKDERIEKVNELLLPLFNEPVFSTCNDKIRHFGFGETANLIENKFEGQLDTGKLISSLWNYCQSLGVRIHTGCDVRTIETDNEVTVDVGSFQFVSNKIGICTNAFTKDLLNEPLDIHPGRGMVLYIQPESLPFEGTFHYEEGYYYFRDYYGKLLFGGGRSLDLEGEETTAFGINQSIKEKLESDLKNIIIPGLSYDILNEWSGIMAFGENKQPIVKKMSDNLAIGVRLGGMGVAIGSLVGEEVGKLLLD